MKTTALMTIVGRTLERFLLTLVKRGHFAAPRRVIFAANNTLGAYIVALPAPRHTTDCQASLVLLTLLCIHLADTVNITLAGITANSIRYLEPVQTHEDGLIFRARSLMSTIVHDRVDVVRTAEVVEWRDHRVELTVITAIGRPPRSVAASSAAIRRDVLADIVYILLTIWTLMLVLETYR